MESEAVLRPVQKRLPLEVGKMDEPTAAFSLGVTHGPGVFQGVRGEHGLCRLRGPSCSSLVNSPNSELVQSPLL